MFCPIVFDIDSRSLSACTVLYYHCTILVHDYLFDMLVFSCLFLNCVIHLLHISYSSNFPGCCFLCFPSALPLPHATSHASCHFLCFRSCFTSLLSSHALCHTFSCFMSHLRLHVTSHASCHFTCFMPLLMLHIFSHASCH